MKKNKLNDPYKNWKQELDSYLLYKQLAKIEKNNSKGKLFESLSQESLNQANIWKEKSLDDPINWEYSPSIKIKIFIILLHKLGPKFLLHFLSAFKIRGLSLYLLPHTQHYEGLNANENVHSRIKSGSNLRAAIFGMNDGLVSNASLVFAMVGASSDNKMIILTGISGLLAGSFSMAAGEFISVKSQTELFENQIRIEKEELEEFPEEEAKELSLIYQAKGIDKITSDAISNSLIQDPEKALDTLVREELGLNPFELGSAVQAAASSFISFSFGAIIPIFPYLIFSNPTAIKVSLSLSLGSLFCIGVIISTLTGKSPILSGIRMCTLGLIAGAITYFIGHLIGISIT